jgi:hypothetical protein
MEHKPIIIIDYLQTRLDCSIAYTLVELDKKHKRVMPTVKAYSGNVGINAAKRIKRAITVLAMKTQLKTVYSYAAKKSVNTWVNMITLTIPCEDNVNHEEAKGCLQLFLKQIRLKYNAEYVWKAELQSRGQIHFHVLTDAFIEWREIRDRWNKLMRKMGWLDKYNFKMGHWNANSTDVKAIVSPRDIELYMAKYVSKVNKGLIKGKVWDCSSRIKGVKYFTTEMVSENFELAVNGEAEEYRLERCAIFKLKQGQEQMLTDLQKVELDFWKKA